MGTELKNKLYTLRSINNYIKACTEELAVLMSRTTRITNYYGISHGGGSQIEELYEQISQKQDKLLNIVLQKERLVNWFNELLVQLDMDEQAILTDRYINGKSLDRIARDRTYTDRQAVWKKIDKILDKIKVDYK